MFLRGWAGYFRYGTQPVSVARFGTTPSGGSGWDCVQEGNRGRGLAVGRNPAAAICGSPWGLAGLHRIVIPPRPFRDWRVQAERRR
jgi:RNA-directed DNA polymerase